ncbi:MAG: 30S ribosomal protein S6 [Ruminococcaceae bacterium]|nr:30S ribosomal protein S6 [Oscillospiraceae bacterium]
MDKLNSLYETIFIVSLNEGEEKTEQVKTKFTELISANGEIVEVNDWGKRRLAYPINDLTEGYYCYVKFNAPAEFPAELERIYNITEGILRSIVVKLDA